MRIRKAAIGVIILGGLSLAAACGGNEGNELDARSVGVLTGTIDHFETESFTYSFEMNDSDEGPSTAAGGFDPSAEQRSTSVSNALFDYDYMIIGEDRFLKISGREGTGAPLGWLEAIPEGWLAVDASKLPSSADKALVEQLAPRNAAKVLNHMTGVRARGDGKYIGMVDLTAAKESVVVTAHNLGEYGDKAEAVPFEATVDPQGRLTKLTLTIDPGKDTMTMTFANWGRPLNLTPPRAREVTDAPSALYVALGRT